MRFQESPFFRLVIAGSRFFLGLVFFSAGMGKLIEFPGLIGPVWLEEALAEHGLALYARFIAYSQIVVGVLLLSVRFATLGAIMLAPILLNIFMVTVSLGWRGTPYVVLVLLLLNAFLLLADYPRLKYLLVDDPAALRPYRLRRPRPFTDGLWGFGLLLVLLAPLGWRWAAWFAYALMVAGFLLFFFCERDARRFRRTVEQKTSTGG